jgi:hypothetical protein
LLVSWRVAQSSGVVTPAAGALGFDPFNNWFIFDRVFRRQLATSGRDEICGSAFRAFYLWPLKGDDVKPEPRLCSLILAEATVCALPTKLASGEPADEFDSFGM